MNSSTTNKTGSSGSRIQTRPSSLPKGRTIAKSTIPVNNQTSTMGKPRPSSASVSRGSTSGNKNSSIINAEKKARPLPATTAKDGPVTRTSFETGSQVKEELKEKAKLSIRNQRLTERYYLTSLQLLKRVNAGACKDNKERKVAMDRLKLMENLHLQSIETTDLSLLASEENLKKMHKNKYPNIQPKIYEASKNYGAGAEKEREKEERERLNQTNSKPSVEQEVEKPRRTLRAKAASSTNITQPTNKIEKPEENNSPSDSDNSDDSDSDTSSENELPKTRPPPNSNLYRPQATTSTSVSQDDKPKRTLRGGKKPTPQESQSTDASPTLEPTESSDTTNE